MTERSPRTDLRILRVGELIKLLENYHDNTPVFVDGYEDDFDPLALRVLRVVPKEHAPWYSGEWEQNDHSGIEALILQRTKSS